MEPRYLTVTQHQNGTYSLHIKDRRYENTEEIATDTLLILRLATHAYDVDARIEFKYE